MSCRLPCERPSVGSGGTQAACTLLMNALNRRSVVVIAMTALMAISLGIIMYEAFISTEEAVWQHKLWRWGRICVGAPGKDHAKFLCCSLEVESHH